MDFEITMPINLVYAISALMPKPEMRKVEDVAIPGRDREIPARVYWPRASAEPGAAPPLIVYYHGGGFVVGSVDIFDGLARSIADAAGAVLVSVGYRLAPRDPYPAAIDDAFAALEWAAASAARLEADPSQLLVAGDSAGGNLAAVVALKARDRGGPPLAGQILYYPATDLSDTDYPQRPPLHRRLRPVLERGGGLPERLRGSCGRPTRSLPLAPPRAQPCRPAPGPGRHRRLRSPHRQRHRLLGPPPEE